MLTRFYAMRYLLTGWIIFGWTVVAAMAHAGHPLAGRGVKPAGLTCEYLIDPVGIDASQPRLAWSLTAPAQPRGQRQTAYQVLVAGDAKMLAADRGDLWDSGRVASDTVQTVYAGHSLESYRQCFWKVRVWDKDGTASDWSSPASWSMGILDAKVWQARWLRYAKVPPPSPRRRPAQPPRGRSPGAKSSKARGFERLSISPNLWPERRPRFAAWATTSCGSTAPRWATACSIPSLHPL